jgi:hypothetical protein
MTDQDPDGGGPSLSFEKVRGPARSEHAPTASELIAEVTAANLAFEATPRTPPPPALSPADARVQRSSDLVATPEPAHKTQAFQAVPASVGVAQQRLSTAAPAVRPEANADAGASLPGGKGWNIRPRDDDSWMRRSTEPEGPPAWSQRTTPAMTADRSAWTVAMPRERRRLSGRAMVGILLSVILVGILGFAAFEWATGGDHATVTIATPASVGNLTAISTTATAEVTAEMEKVMLAYGATRVVSGVYGAGGQPTLVVLLAQGPDTGTTSTQFFNDFASGLQSDGLTVDQTKTIAATSDGSNFVCSPASRPAPLPPVSLCGWDDGATIGLVMDVTSQPVNTTLSEAEAARRAGEH